MVHATGEAAAGVQAVAVGASGSEITASADAAGTYSITSLPDGSYNLFVRLSTDSPVITQIYSGIDAPQCRFGSCIADARTGTPVGVMNGLAVTGINFTLTTPGGFSRRLTMGGSGVMGSVGSVEVFDARGVRLSVPHERPNEDGYATPIVVGPNASVTGIDFELDPAATITGAISSAVSLSASRSTVVQAVRPDGTVAATTTGIDSYTLGGLAAGTYYIRSFGHVRVGFPPISTGEIAPALYNGAPCDAPDCPVAGGTAGQRQRGSGRPAGSI